MIQAIDLTKLRNAEYLQFTTDVLRIVDINNPTTLQVQAKYDALNDFKNDLETLFKNRPQTPSPQKLKI
jgi:50S ribosomal subunit-associated GTPase HflX